MRDINFTQYIEEITQITKETDTQITKRIVRNILDAQSSCIFKNVTDKQVGRIQTGFGIIKVVDTAEKKGRNPQTGEAIIIPAGRKIKFKASKIIRDNLK